MQCNAHEDVGICDSSSGSCYCRHHTEGRNCELCREGFYGDPREGRACLRACGAKVTLSPEAGEGVFFGSYGGRGEECLWIIGEVVREAQEEANVVAATYSTFTVTIISASDVSCENPIYVYEGLPDFISSSKEEVGRSRLVGRVCNNPGKRRGGPNALKKQSQRAFSARVGRTLSIFYRRTHRGRGGFNASLTANTAASSNREDTAGEVCADGPCSAERGDKMAHWNRFGYSLTAAPDGSKVWLFGGYSPGVRHPLLSDVRLYDVERDEWEPVVIRCEDGEESCAAPGARFFHAACVEEGGRAMFVYGGRDETGFLSDLWEFDFSNMSWHRRDLLPASPALSGHTLTWVTGKERLVLVGGLGESGGFFDRVAEIDPRTSAWREVETSGVGPRSLFSHSAFYHRGKETIFVVGREMDGGRREEPSSFALFSLHLPSSRWDPLPTYRTSSSSGRFYRRPPPPPLLLLPPSPPAQPVRAAAFGGRNYMVVREESDGTGAEKSYAYVFNCLMWWDVTGKAADLATSKAVHNLTSSSGGSSSSSRSSVREDVRLLSEVARLPRDVCNLFAGNPDSCVAHVGCSHCAQKETGNYSEEQSACLDNSVPPPWPCQERREGFSCEQAESSGRDCSDRATCVECLSGYAANESVACSWCCGRCHDDAFKCRACGLGGGEEGQEFQWPRRAEECPGQVCSGRDCNKCLGEERGLEGEPCVWTRHFSRLTDHIRAVSASGEFDWTCEKRSVLDRVNRSLGGELNAYSEECPAGCSSFGRCQSCTANNGSDCLWSPRLEKCLDASLAPILCGGGGICGPTVSRHHHCPPSCADFRQCRDCLSSSHCGWYAEAQDLTGEGVCREGWMERPKGGGARRGEGNKSSFRQEYWHFFSCPPEDECSNGHHSCDERTEACVDTEEGFRCDCLDGYEREGRGCVPVCRQGCVHGVCAAPGECRCQFSYVGDSCHLPCMCNGHSDCEGEGGLDRCLNCLNNTQGDRCQRCRPGYVGNPRDGGECRSCSEFCHGMSNQCVKKKRGEEEGRKGQFSIDDLLEEKEEEKPAGLLEEEATCVDCRGNSEGERCERCSKGFFSDLSLSSNRALFCRPCECNGHGDSCDWLTGESCNCANNTVSACHSSSSSSSSTSSSYHRRLSHPSSSGCWRSQCSKCKDFFLGEPRDGRQCYRQMSVDAQFCLDMNALAFESCAAGPMSPGGAAFFAVQPKFLNVDVRVFFDLSEGARVDVYLAHDPSVLKVELDRAEWRQEITINPPPEGEEAEDRNGNATHTRERPRRSLSNPEIADKELLTVQDTSAAVQKKVRGSDLVEEVTLHDRDSLTTFIHLPTPSSPSSVLVLRGLSSRLILSMPQSEHDLRSVRFYLAVVESREGGGENSTSPVSGVLSFRQDQLHIDLFVFFSVFFSCFFLFLSGCVVVWRLKAARDGRRERNRRIMELR